MMALFSAFGGDLPSITLIVVYILEGSVLWFSFSPMFVCCSGVLVVHQLQGGRGGISRSEVLSYSHPFQYFRWDRLCINTVSSRGYML